MVIPYSWQSLDQAGIPIPVLRRIAETLAYGLALSTLEAAHHESVQTVGDVQRVVDVDARDVTKSLALVVGANTKILVCLRGAGALDVPAIRRLFGGRPVRFATADEALAFGAPVGSLSPLLSTVPTVIDRSLLCPSRMLYMGSGVADWSIRAHSSVLLYLRRAVIAAVAKDHS